MGRKTIDDFVATNANPTSWPLWLRATLFGALSVGTVAIALWVLIALWNYFFSGYANGTSKPESEQAQEQETTSIAFEDEPGVGWVRHPLVTQYEVEEKLAAIEVDGGRSTVQLLKLKRDGVTKAKVAVIRLHDQSYWRRGKYDAVEVGNRRPVDLSAWFDKSRLTGRLAKSEFILCIGLASSNAESREANEQLSYQRSEKLCDWLRQSRVVHDANQRLKAVPLGMALTYAEAESDLERRQRAAIIIGISRENELIDLSTIYDEIASRAMVDGLSLSDYSRVKSAGQGLD